MTPTPPQEPTVPDQGRTGRRLQGWLLAGAVMLGGLTSATWWMTSQGESPVSPAPSGAERAAESDTDDEALSSPRPHSLIPPGGTGALTITGLVLHDGTDPQGALARAVRDLGAEPEHLRLSTIAEAVASHPAEMIGPGRVSTCTSETTTNGRVLRVLSTAEEHLEAGELTEAMTVLRTAEERMGCITEPVMSPTAFQVFYLQGIAAVRSGDAEQAGEHFRQARLFDPTGSWDRRFGTEGADLFRHALDDASPKALITLAPGPRAGVQMDGMSLSMPKFAVAFARGTHLIQQRDEWAPPVRLDLESGSATLIVPSWLPWNAVSWVSTPEGNQTLGLILGTVLDPEQPVYAVHAGSVWRLDFEDKRWSRVE